MNNLIYDENTKSYYFENDKEAVDEYMADVSKLKNKDDYYFHLEVLPQPYFGEIENPYILILANNPSYVEGDDEFDRDLYLRHKQLPEYLDTLKKVNFLDYERIENKYFFNTWQWWHKNVFGNITLKDKSNKIGIINLCGYHSKQFNSNKSSNLMVNNLKDVITQAKVIVFVWKSTYDIITKEYPEELKNKPFIILTKGNQFGKTNTLEKVLFDDNISKRYNESYEEDAKMFLKKHFSN